MSLNHLEYNELNRYIYDLIKLVARLLSEWGGEASTEGSNPSLSASLYHDPIARWFCGLFFWPGG